MRVGRVRLFAAGLIFAIFIVYQLCKNASVNHETAFRQKFFWLTSRSMNDFIHVEKDTTLLEAEMFSNKTSGKARDLENGQPLLTVVIISSPQNKQIRRVLRETWAQHRTAVNVIFLCGVHQSAVVNEELTRESLVFGDIVQQNFHEHYLNLTIKSVMMLKHILRQQPTRIGSFILKVDDDVYVRMPQLVSYLHWCTTAADATCNPTKPFCGGHLYRSVEADRNPSSKWYLPPQLYAGKKRDSLPDFVSGTAYLISAPAVHQLYKTALTVPFINLEDVFISGLVAHQASVPLLHLSGFHKNRPWWLHPCIVLDALTIHSLNWQQMKTLHDRLTVTQSTSHCDSLAWRVARSLMIWIT